MAKKQVRLSSYIKQKNYIALFVFFFIVGVVWGKFFYFSEENRSAIFKPTTLHLLAEENFLPGDIVESFAIENDTQILVTTYKTKADLSKLVQLNKYDLVAFKSFHIDEVKKSLDVIFYKELKNKDYISVDFRNLPFDPESKLSIPLFWGINKKENIDKSILWIESIGINKASQYKKESHEFLDYMLNPDVALEVVRHKKVASTSKALEKEKTIDSKFKPSYLRKISIRNLSFEDKASF